MPKSQPVDRDTDKSDGGGDPDGRRQVMRYAGLTGQIAVSVGVAVWLGVKADRALKFSFPIFSWFVPLLVIVILLLQIIKANSGKKDEK
jgi:cytochrome bd-type quinol oxidase subunit 2